MICTPLVVGSVYNGRDNRITLILFGNGEVITDLGAVSRVVMEIGGQTIDSDVVGQTVIWWFESVQYRGEQTNVLRFKLGEQGIPSGVYDDVKIAIYNPVYANGLMVENSVKITVYD